MFDVLSKVTGGSGDDADEDASDAASEAQPSGPDDLSPEEFRDRADTLANRSDVPELDFSAASLPDLDTIATGNHPVDDELSYGSYLGETLVREYDGEWVRDDGWAVRVELGDDDTTVAVFDAATMALERGPVFEQVAQQLHAQGDPYASGSTPDAGTTAKAGRQVTDETTDIEEPGDEAAADASEEASTAADDGSVAADAAPDDADAGEPAEGTAEDTEAANDEVETGAEPVADDEDEAGDESGLPDEGEDGAAETESVADGDEAESESGLPGDGDDVAAEADSADEGDEAPVDDGDRDGTPAAAVEDEAVSTPATDHEEATASTTDEEGVVDARSSELGVDSDETTESDLAADDSQREERSAADDPEDAETGGVEPTAAGDASADERESDGEPASADEPTPEADRGDDLEEGVSETAGSTADATSQGTDETAENVAVEADSAPAQTDAPADGDDTAVDDAGRAGSGTTSESVADDAIDADADLDAPSVEVDASTVDERSDATADAEPQDEESDDPAAATAPDGEPAGADDDVVAPDDGVDDAVANDDVDDEAVDEPAEAGEDDDPSPVAEDDPATEDEPAPIPSRSAYEAAAIEFCNNWPDQDFDYTPASLARLDDFLDDQWEGRFRPGSLDGASTDPEAVSGPLVEVGAYVGEVLVRHYDGEWVPGETGEAAVAVAGRHGRREVFPVFDVTRTSLIHQSRVAYQVDALANRLDVDVSASGAEHTGFALGDGGPGTHASSADVITTILDRAEAFVEDWKGYDLNYRPASLVRLDNLVKDELDAQAFRDASLGDTTDGDALRLADRAAGASAYFAAVLVRHLDAQWKIGEDVALSVEGPIGEARVVPLDVGVTCLRMEGKFMKEYDRVHDAVDDDPHART